jgi:hypothetical protein
LTFSEAGWMAFVRMLKADRIVRLCGVPGSQP